MRSRCSPISARRCPASSGARFDPYETVLIGSRVWQTHTARKAYSLTVDNPANVTALRAEVRPSDVWANDAGRHPIRTRSEIMSPDRYNHGQSLWWAFGQKITGTLPVDLVEEGELTHVVISQWHANDAAPAWMISPFLSFQIDPDGKFYVRYLGSNTEGQFGDQQNAVAIADYEFGRRYDYVMHFVPSPTAATLEVWRDGIKIVDIQPAAGKAIGYVGDTDFYQKHGLYNSNIASTLVAEYFDIVNPGTTSLAYMVS